MSAFGKRTRCPPSKLPTAGALDRKVTIQGAPVNTPDMAGGFTVTYPTLLSTWAAYKPLRSTEWLLGEQVRERFDAIYEIRYPHGVSVTVGMRLADATDGSTYSITEARPADSGQTFMRLHCQSIAPSG
jgi:head-tail adaptor